MTSEADDPVRLLVLTSSTGSGHDMRARAFAAWVRRLSPGVGVRIAHIIEDSSWLGSFGVWLYNFIQRLCPRLHHIYWHIVEVVAGTHHGKVSFGGKYYRRLISEYRPHVVVSFHDSTNRGYFEDARALLGAERVFCATYSGEWSGGYGFSRNWVNPTADLYGARTPEALQTALALGIPEARTRLVCKFLPPEAFVAPMETAERRALRASLEGLDEDRFTVFLATGGYGANHHERFLDALLPLCDRVQVFAVCGRNRRALKRLKAWKRAHPELALHFEGYSERMHHYLQVSDCVVTRGGANTTAEAIHFGCPVLFDTLGGDMPQERLTIAYLADKGAAAIVRKASDLTEVLAEWSQRGTAYAKVLASIRALDAKDTPAAFVQEILEGAQACAKVRSDDVSPIAN